MQLLAPVLCKHYESIFIKKIGTFVCLLVIVHLHRMYSDNFCFSDADTHGFLATRESDLLLNSLRTSLSWSATLQ